MAISLNQTIQTNLMRLWKSNNLVQHDLAFQMLDGFHLSEKDYQWLWECYQELNSEQKNHSSLRNLHEINKHEIIQGKILSIVLTHETIAHTIFNSFLSNNTLNIPYTTLSSIPSSLFSFPYLIQELIWQDGELKTIDQNIKSLTQIQRLDLRRQPIEFIHPNIIDCLHLKDLHLVSTSFLPDEIIDRQDMEIYTDAPY